MKKILLLISHYFSNFLAALSIFTLLLLYIMFKVPVVFWVGNMAGRNFTDNFGGILIEFLKNDYLLFFLYPFLPFAIGFLLLSVFIWLFYRRDKEMSKIGFKNTILSILAIFFLVFPPIQSARLGYKIQEQRDLQISQIYNDDTTYINKGFNKEFLKLYQTFADEGIQTWRKDPVAVVKNELEKGDLTSLSHGVNELTLKIINTDKNKYPGAVVMLKNERLQAEIWLSQYWESADGVWLVKSYKILTDSSNEKK